MLKLYDILMMKGFMKSYLIQQLKISKYILLILSFEKSIIIFKLLQSQLFFLSKCFKLYSNSRTLLFLTNHIFYIFLKCFIHLFLLFVQLYNSLLPALKYFYLRKFLLSILILTQIENFFLFKKITILVKLIIEIEFKNQMQKKKLNKFQ